MAKRPILILPDERLRAIAEPIEKIDDGIKQLAKDKLETMYDAPGIGLAAIQVAVPLRVLVIDLQPEDPDAEPEVCTAHGGHHHTHRRALCPGRADCGAHRPGRWLAAV